MSLILQGSTSGSVTLQEPAVAGTTVLTLPAVSGTVLTTTSPKAGNVIQVVSTAKTDTFTTTSTSFTDVTGLSVSITPTSSTSTILVLVQIGMLSVNGTNRAALRMVRGSTAIDVGATASNRTLATTAFSTNGVDVVSQSAGMVFLDSPATTSATTYKVQGIISGGDTLYINRNSTDTDSSLFYRTASTITVMEIAA